ncbi:MAG: DUF4153 domain-containing protein [Kiloniellales bacterium]
MRHRLREQWEAFRPLLKETPARFPLPFACAVLFSVVVILGIHDFTRLDDLEARLLWFSVIGFFLFLAIHLLGEARGWPRGYPLLVSLVAGGLLAWRIAAADLDSFWTSGINFFLAPACVLAVIAAPFALARQADNALWHFNRVAWFGFAFALLVGLVLGGGLSSALWALEELFGLDVEEEAYGDVWTLSLALLTPWLALAAVPRSFEAPAEPPVPKAIAFLATFILIPLAVGYFAILYAFMVKIAVQWSLPRGEVATLIMGYAGFGVATHLIAYPLREAGLRHVRAFHRWFYPALIVPAGLLAIAIGLRVAAYGVTEDRYLVMAVAAWLLFIAPFMTLRPRTGLKAAPLSLAALLALGSFGPWGAESLSLSSQLGRLERLLTSHGLLRDGRIVPSEDPVPREDLIQISSTVSYLRDTGKHMALAPWFEGIDLDFATNPYAKEIVEAMGLTFQLYARVVPGFRFYAQQNSLLGDIEGFDRIGRVQLYAYGQPWKAVLGPDAGGETYSLRFDPEDGHLIISGQTGPELSLDLDALVARLNESGASEAVEDFHLEAANEALRVRLIFQDLSGTIDGSRIRVQSGGIFVLIDRSAE